MELFKRSEYYIHTKKFGYLVLTRAMSKHGRSFYISPIISPYAATFYIGGKDHYSKELNIKASIRRALLGHNYSYDENRELSMAINYSFELNKNFYISQFAEKNRGTRRRAL